MSETNSWYERWGGVYSIATLVDDFIDRMMADARPNANPLVGDAHHVEGTRKDSVIEA